MKSFLLLLLFVVVVVVSDQWSSFKFKFNKVYRTHEEESYHKSCFVRNLQLIAIKNSISNEVTYGITKFADLCSEDLKRLFPTIPVDGRRGKEASTYPRNEAIKAKTQPFDWRKKGAVTNVKDQGECGATWAFAAAENMEGQWYLASHGLYNLSAQELVSCDPNSQGCNGGYSDYAQKYAVANGITSADIYPYTSGTTMDSGICEPNKVKQPVARFRDMIYIPGYEDQMLTWTAQNGPLSVAIGSVTDFYFYTGGIITSCPPTGVDHCVNLVGYGILPNGTSYWIAKNMWGTDWGENGYFRMLYGQNTCNLTALASSVQV